MEEWRGDAALQLGQAEAQCGHRHQLVAIHRTIPLELTGRCEAELVRQVALLVTLLIVLVLVEGQGCSAVLVHILLVAAIHP